MTLMEAFKRNEETTERDQPNGFLPITFRQKLLNSCCGVPVPEKCCFCLPLRHGFLVFAYIKVVTSVALFFFILYFLLVMMVVFGNKEILTQCLTWFSLCLDTVDIVIGICIIVSSYKKNLRTMELYYRYSIYVYVLLAILCVGLSHKIGGDINALLILISILILIMLMQVYLILMVRSEVLKLKSNAQFHFLNNEPEPLCTYTNNVDN